MFGKELVSRLVPVILLFVKFFPFDVWDKLLGSDTVSS